MKTCKNFCDERNKQQKKFSIKTNKKIRADLKVMSKKSKNSFGKRKLNIMAHIKNMKSFLKYAKDDKEKIEKINRETCNTIYCNPECKGMIFENNPEYPLVDGFYTKLPSAYVKKIRKEGAISACIRSKPISF